MPSLSLEVKSRSMATSTRIFRTLAGIEYLYYVLLLTADRERAAKLETWQSWAQLGFHMSVKNPPPAVRDNEKAAVTVDVSGEPDLVFNVEGGAGKAIAALRSLLEKIDGARARRGAENETARLAAVKEDSAITAALIAPLNEALKNSGCGWAASDFDFATNRALTVLAHPQIESSRVR
jgi:hypothetical protein